MRTLTWPWDNSPKHLGTDLLLQDSPPITRYPLGWLARMPRRWHPEVYMLTDFRVSQRGVQHNGRAVIAKSTLT
jgi:hypothetical protein